jgi:hypothetical protein
MIFLSCKQYFNRQLMTTILKSFKKGLVELHYRILLLNLLSLLMKTGYASTPAATAETIVFKPHSP